MITLEAIIWYLLLFDSIMANLTVLFWKKWWKQHKKWNKIFPISIAWTLMYLVLIMWIGLALYRLKILF